MFLFLSVYIQTVTYVSTYIYICSCAKPHKYFWRNSSEVEEKLSFSAAILKIQFS